MSDKRDCVTIVITTYRRHDELDQAIQSVVEQTHQNIEIIIVDDNADPSWTASIEKAYGNGDCIRWVHNDRNLGASASRNLGIQVSSGDYIAFLDDDDTWARDKLEKQLMIFDSNPDVGFVGCGYYDIGILDGRLPVAQGDVSRILLKTFGHIETSTVLFRRSLVNQIGLTDISLPSEQNHDFFYRMSKITKFDFVPEILMTKGSPSQQISKDCKNKIVGYVRYHRKHMGDIMRLPIIERMGVILKIPLILILFLIFSSKDMDVIYNQIQRVVG
jgi:glycosyltransferase involved in cell wall biosynthesis